ncbi:MAG: VanZ family protein [Phycisphaerales bacterium]|nr:MAG: VanZ family protein [Phycisphaerales bacterium]
MERHVGLSIRRKVTIGLLAVYWPALAIFSHLPVPMWVRKAGVSDKVLHLLAYMILAFLLWCAIGGGARLSPGRASAWLVFLVVVLYGGADELVQGYVGRSCDIVDFAADVAGALAGLVVFWFLPFWPAALLVAGTAVFGLTNLTRTSLSELLGVTSAVFHLFAHGVFALIWVRNVELYSAPKAPRARWLPAAAGVPIAFLLLVKVFSAVFRRDFSLRDVAFSLLGIMLVVFGVLLARSAGRRANGGNRGAA